MTETILGVEGMMCGMCEAHINDAVRRAFSVKSVKSDRKKARCVILSESELDREALAKVIADTGYTLTSVTSSAYHKKGLFGR